RTVRHAHAGVAGRDVNVRRIAGVAADVRQPVERLEHHARPRVQNAVALRDVLAGPGGQPLEPIADRVLAALVVLAADDQFVGPASVTTFAGSSDSTVRTRVRSWMRPPCLSIARTRPETYLSGSNCP